MKKSFKTIIIPENEVKTYIEKGYAIKEDAFSVQGSVMYIQHTDKEIADYEAKQKAQDQVDDIQNKISVLKQQLADMDYKTSKYSDGEYSEEEWESIKSERKLLRNKIKQLEIK